MITPRKPISRASIVVLASAVEDEDPGAIVASNVEFVNMLFEEYVDFDEISQDALRSFYVDLFIAELENGGFSQFVYNTYWDPQIVAYVREGLKAMGGKRHLKAFEKGAKLADAMGRPALEAYSHGAYFGDNDDRDDLSDADEPLTEAGEKEDLVELHAAWLRNHPDLFIMETEDEMREEARRRGAAITNLEERKVERAAGGSRGYKLIHMLCKRAGHSFDRLIGVDSTRMHAGVNVAAYHFITDKGHFHAIEHAGKAMMFRGESTTDCVCVIDMAAKVLN